MECIYFISGLIVGVIIILALLKLLKKDENDIEAVLNRVLENYNKHFLFSNNQQVGAFGEYVLENVLTSVGLKKDREYFLQKKFDDKRPDVVIKLCDDKCLFIDSKANLKDYNDYLNANNEKDKNKKLNQIKSAIKTQVKNLSEKKYHEIGSTNSLIDFTLMFIPIESLYMFLFDNDNELFEYAIKKRVMIVSPSSLICILKIINSFNLKLKQKENVTKIVEIASNLGNKYFQMFNEFKKVQSAFSKINDDFFGNDNIQAQIEQLKEYGVELKSNDNILS
ncbi:MAG: DNA recombination protein RmuC [Candidatus Gastranaerophilales bacterium]|nr:DNA recombination protein RmuC [Candidatus Gastranaerophilales bacterium]